MVELTYQQRHRVRERILAYGGPGTGKSTAIATVVLHTPDVHHYIIDNEIDNYERLFLEDPMFGPIQDRIDDTVHIYSTDSTNWDEQLAATEEAGARAEPRDWLHFDMITDTWEAVQGWFTQSIFNADLADYFIEVRKQLQEHNERAASNSKLKEQKNLAPFEGFTDWSVINPQYKKLYKVFMTGTKANVFIVAEEDQIRKDNEDRQIRATYGEIGYKPKGQKKLGHVPHTVIRFTKNQRDEWYMTGVKDRGRELPDDLEFRDFAKTYLLKIANWKAAKFDG